jgi:TonB family protein
MNYTKKIIFLLLLITPFVIKAQTEGNYTFEVKKEQFKDLKIVLSPIYPKKSIIEGHQGVVYVIFSINKDKKTYNIYIKNKGEVHESLERSAINCVKHAVVKSIEFPIDEEITAIITYTIK